MEGKNPERNPRPGLTEAIHPELGNGALWESDPHLFHLKSPDPVKVLDALLIEQETSETVIESWTAPAALHASIETASPPETTENLQTGDLPAPQLLNEETANIAEVPGTDQRRIEPGTIEKPSKRKKKAETIPSPPAENQLTAETDIINHIHPKKAAKAGKLLRKAAKSLKKKEEKQRIASEKSLEATFDTGLSPFTRWLKGLRGSEYVHPYDDDFAFTQGSGPAKEGISETFADLLAAQGYKEQAVEMYMKLMEKYPEKSGFFAAKIDALQ